MRWWRDRRGYGQLRLPVDRRAQRRTSWLDKDLRVRRGELLRAHWPHLGAIVGIFAVSDLALVLGAYGHPVLQGALVGIYLGAVAVFMVVFVSLTDGSLLARLGRMVEDEVGDELRATTGVYGVVSGLSFEKVDVDHVVLSPSGVYAVEVKALFGRRPASVEQTYGLGEKLQQARRGARKVGLLLAGRGCSVVVRPLLVLAGPGAPVLDGVVNLGGVLVVAFRDSATWHQDMTKPTPALNLAAAGRVADHLLAYQAQRRDYHEPPRSRLVSTVPTR